jgi:uncharacterized hydantoinase/oxoprolinase family protein
VRSRLARIVCADPEQLAEGDLEAIAAAVEEAQIASITAALRRVAERLSAPVPVAAVGVGAFLARAAAQRCGLPVDLETGLPSPLGGSGADVAPAVALSVLARE